MANTKVPAELSSTPGIVDNSSATALTIDSAGAATFSSSAAEVAKFTSSAVGTAITLNNTHANAWGSNIAFQTGGTAAGFVGSIGSLIGSTDQTLAVYGAAGNGVGIYTNGNNQRLYIDTSGNVGIGNSSPDLKLNVSHGTAAQYVATFQNTANNNQLKIGNQAQGYLNIQGARIDNGNAYNFSLQADGGNVGIGVSAPNEKLESSGAIRVLGTTATSRNSGTLSFNGTLFNIESRGPDVSNRGTIGFYQATSSGASAIQSMLLDSSGNLGLGVTPTSGRRSNESAIDMGNFTTNATISNYSNVGWLLTHNTYINSAGQFDRKGTGVSAIYSTVNGAHEWASDASTTTGVFTPTVRMRLDASGNVEIPDGNLSFAAGHGIDFSATANAGGTSNAMSSELLDDYEEGTWYPYLGTETQLGSPASTNYNNFYVKVGRLVKCTGYFNQWNYANVTSGTYMMIRNLPFPPRDHDIGMRFGYASNIGSSTYGYGNTSLSAFYLLIGGTTGAPTHYTRAAAPTSGAAYAMITVTYYTAS